MTPDQQEKLNRLFEETFGITLPEGKNISLSDIEWFMGRFVTFEQDELSPEDYINILRGMDRR